MISLDLYKQFETLLETLKNYQKDNKETNKELLKVLKSIEYDLASINLSIQQINKPLISTSVPY